MNKREYEQWRDTTLQQLTPETAVAIVRYLINGDPYLEDWVGFDDWEGPEGRFANVYDDIIRRAQDGTAR